MRSMALAALALVACAPQPPLANGQGKVCSVTRLGKLVGKVSTVALAEEAIKRAGASTARVIGPGQAVTMDYRQDRLNIHLDADGKVERFTCG